MQDKSCGSLGYVLYAAAWSLLLVLGALAAWPQTSQNSVPATAREAAQMPEFAQKLAASQKTETSSIGQRPRSPRHTGKTRHRLRSTQRSQLLLVSRLHAVGQCHC